MYHCHAVLIALFSLTVITNIYLTGLKFRIMNFESLTRPPPLNER